MRRPWLFQTTVASVGWSLTGQSGSLGAGGATETGVVGWPGWTLAMVNRLAGSGLRRCLLGCGLLAGCAQCSGCQNGQK